MNIQLHAALAFLAVTGAGASVDPVSAPRTVSASYNWLRNGVHVAVMNETFEAHNNNYRITSESSAVGWLALFRRDRIVFTSSGQITSSGLRPQRFEGRRDDRTEVRAEFEWGSEQLKLIHEGRNDAIALPSGAQDRLSVMYQFMFWQFDQLRQLDFVMTNGRKIERYHYDITPNVNLDTPLGRMSTLHLVKRREPGDNGTEVWIAPQHRYLPVKVLIIERDGTRQEQIITRLELKP